MGMELFKQPGLYDTFETEDIDLSEYFDEEEYEMLGSYNGLRFRKWQR